MRCQVGARVVIKMIQKVDGAGGHPSKKRPPDFSKAKWQSRLAWKFEEVTASLND